MLSVHSTGVGTRKPVGLAAIRGTSFSLTLSRGAEPLPTSLHVPSILLSLQGGLFSFFIVWLVRGQRGLSNPSAASWPLASTLLILWVPSPSFSFWLLTLAQPISSCHDASPFSSPLTFQTAGVRKGSHVSYAMGSGRGCGQLLSQEGIWVK